ncbi:MAG TPA: hypothetical protein VFA89_18025 [Terriglobales bacterium]|nr:hypothetical protein [Terriglobales bacterium]
MSATIPLLLGSAVEYGQQISLAHDYPNQGVGAGEEEEWRWGDDPDLWMYRKHTVALLKRYGRMSVEVGRLPSLLGREFFRTGVTSYHMSTFEDAVIFVHDVERSLERLDEFSKKLIARIVLQDYNQEEAARMLGCCERQVRRQYTEAIDYLSEVFLAGGLLKRE